MVGADLDILYPNPILTKASLDIPAGDSRRQEYGCGKMRFTMPLLREYPKETLIKATVHVYASLKKPRNIVIKK